MGTLPLIKIPSDRDTFILFYGSASRFLCPRPARTRAWNALKVTVVRHSGRETFRSDRIDTIYRPLYIAAIHKKYDEHRGQKVLHVTVPIVHASPRHPCTYKSQEERHKLGMNHKILCVLVAFFHRLLFQFAALRHYSCAANATEVLR